MNAYTYCVSCLFVVAIYYRVYYSFKELNVQVTVLFPQIKDIFAKCIIL